MKTLDRIIEFVAAVIMGVMIITVSLQVFYRYVLIRPLGWTEEIARGTLVWATFLGSYLAFRQNGHMRIGLFFEKMSTKTRSVLKIAGNIIMFLFTLILVVEGGRFAAMFGNMHTPYLELPVTILYVILPIGGALFLVHLVQDTITLIVQQKVEWRKSKEM